jgi:hypothetical protein
MPQHVRQNGTVDGRIVGRTAFSLATYHRHLACERLEDRQLLSVGLNGAMLGGLSPASSDKLVAVAAEIGAAPASEPGNRAVSNIAPASPVASSDGTAGLLLPAATVGPTIPSVVVVPARGLLGTSRTLAHYSALV